MEFFLEMMQFDVHQLVFIDESSKDKRTAQRKKGWFYKHVRHPAAKGEFVRGKRYSVMAALDIEGISSSYVVEGACKEEPFTFGF